MTIKDEINPQRRFVPALLPWLVAIGALAIYLATLNHWVSFSNLMSVSRLSGWNWQPERFGPLYWLLTYPLRWLPEKSIPLGLNLFSALCAALTLALLARSVALLPHDRTEAQRAREQGAFSLLSIRAAWLPPILAALVCGLQLTFWEDSTNGSSEMLDLLVFAYVIRCLLEFRIEERQSWLSRAAFVYGLGMAENWAMMGFLPVFLIALIWLKGLGFFNVSFLGRMSLWGLAGLTLYILMPLTQASSSLGHIPFWPALGESLRSHKLILRTLLFDKQYLFVDSHPLWILALFSLLPLLAISVTWPSYFGDPSRLGVSIATWVLHFFHAVLLLVCVWLALDPQFSPRHNQNPALLAFGVQGMTIYYLAALCVGYFCGYFLLVFGAKPKRPQPLPAYGGFLNRLVLLAIGVLMVLAPATLVYRNLPQLRLTNGPLIKDFATQMLQDLPGKGGFVFSDDFPHLILAQSAAAEQGKSKDYIFVDTASLPAPDYHRFLLKQYGANWPANPAKGEQRRISDYDRMKLLFYMVQSNTVSYLHPSVGPYFEVCYLEPHGLVYKLNLLPTNGVVEVLPAARQLEENQAFWSRIAAADLDPLSAAVAASTSADSGKFGLLDRVVHLAHLKNEQNATAIKLAKYYSLALNFFGVQEQRSGALQAAADYFQRAKNLNPDNVVAEVNFECNQNLLNGSRPTAPFSNVREDKLGKYRALLDVLKDNGPYDDPDICYAEGVVFGQGQLYRQSVRELTRVKFIVPEKSPLNLASRLFLAQVQLARQMPDRALREVSEIHAQAAQLELNRTNMIQLLSIETTADLARNDLPSAEAAVQSALKTYPDDESLLAAAVRSYIAYHQYTNALVLLDRQLKLRPDDPTALVNKGFTCLQLKDYDQAITNLTHVLEMPMQSTNYLALINRACVYLAASERPEAQKDYLSKAQKDYAELEQAFPRSFRVHYGLGEIAYRQKDTNNAIRYYQLYLNAVGTNNPAMKTEINSVTAHLKEMQPQGALETGP